jgi:hypothetical protein
MWNDTGLYRIMKSILDYTTLWNLYWTVSYCEIRGVYVDVAPPQGD